jgi:AAA+ superfamily predicted ATPase
MALVDALLQRAALVARVAFDHRPDPLAGLKVDDEDLLRLLGELPGLHTVDGPLIAELHRQSAPSIDQARAEIGRASSTTGRFDALVRFARLGQAEAEVFAAICAVELDPRRQRVVGYLNDDVSQRRITLFTLQQLFPDVAVTLAAGPGGGLRRAGLLAPTAEGPWSSAALAPSPTVLWWLSGDHRAEADLPPGARGLAAVEGDQAWEPDEESRPTMVLVPGLDRQRRLETARAALGGGPLLITPTPTSAQAWEAVVCQATLERQAVVVELDGPLSPEAAARIDQASHLSFALCSREEVPLASLPERNWTEVPAGAPLATEAEWSNALGPEVPRGRYRLTAEQLEQVGRAVPGLGGDVTRAVRRLASGHISALAPRIRPQRRWDDLVLDEDRTTRLREVVARSQHRQRVFGEWGFAPFPSTGVVALFAGPSGTGKTLAAEIVAGELGVDLYKVDLAGLVSKYIGETEKNLSQVFDAAEASNVALFFDEADALFGKRSDVSDAHDRYANIEVAYLLQRLERYEGLVVLATNLATNIDPAFLRRLHVTIDFPMPEEPERRRIWERSLPPGAPTEDLDLDVLAKLFKLSGGTIRNTALTAAFLAADAGTAITMDIAVEAVQRELRKLGRLLDPAEFGPYADRLKKR